MENPSSEASATALARIAPDPTELARLTSQAREYILAAKSEATLRAYRADWHHFEEWCRQKGFSALPASPHTVACYLGETAQTLDDSNAKASRHLGVPQVLEPKRTLSSNRLYLQ